MGADGADPATVETEQQHARDCMTRKTPQLIPLGVSNDRCGDAVANHGGERMSQALLIEVGAAAMSKAMEKRARKAVRKWTGRTPRQVRDGACGDGVLSLDTLQPAGKRAMPIAELLRGYAIHEGTRLS